ncbi:MAG: recombinase family protein [Caloramator sp.]|nr:recombinase family protein [Caloramator sp.]
MKIAIYLRKSRADEEMEKTFGEGETLLKHRKALLKFANEKNLDVIKIYEEIVSGESLIHRPEMLNLLKDVEAGMYDAVLVMDIQRLGRGDMQDQGIILKTFKNSNTKIITPQKTYDLSNEFDEEYTEFEAFMSRKELKMINRRMQGGRIRSVEDGNYIGTNPPYGYDIMESKKSRTLIPNTEQAPVVKMIFDMYVNKKMGCGMIAQELNSMGYKTQTGKSWYSSAILNILKNPVYIGKITWKKKCIKKSLNPNKKRDAYTRKKEDWIIADGKHESIISTELFEKAQEILKNKYHVPYQIINGARNPLAGIVICADCGSKLVYRPYGNKAPHLICPNKCGNKSSRFDYIEKKIINSFKDYIISCELKINSEHLSSENNNISIYKNKIKNLKTKLEKLNRQKNKLYDLLEQGIYSIDIFLERSNYLNDEIANINDNIKKIEEKINEEINYKHNQENIDYLKNIYELYLKTNDISEKNTLLKKVFYKIEYKKNKNQKNDDFQITLYPKI